MTLQPRHTDDHIYSHWKRQPIRDIYNWRVHERDTGFANDGMTDFMTPEQRSRAMSKVRRRDTGAEIRLRSLLHRQGFRFRKNVRQLPGSPDIVLPKFKAVIFVHGCFWHGHIGCVRSRLPTSRAEFWQSKREANLERDERKIADLLVLGWRAAVVWECALLNAETTSSVVAELAHWIRSQSLRLEVPVAG